MGDILASSGFFNKNHDMVRRHFCWSFSCDESKRVAWLKAVNLHAEKRQRGSK